MQVKNSFFRNLHTTLFIHKALLLTYFCKNIFYYLYIRKCHIFLNIFLDLLDFCDEENRKIAVDTEKQLLGADSESEFEEDFAVAAGETPNKGKKKNKKLSDSELNQSDSDASCYSEDNFSSDIFEDSPKKEKLNSKLIKKSQRVDESEDDDDCSVDEDIEDDIENEDDSEDEEDIENSEEESLKSNKRKLESSQKDADKQKKRKVSVDEDLEEDSSSKEENPEENEDNTKLWEDIYGRTRDQDGNVVTNRYIPPAARAKNLEKDSENSERLIKLRRQLKGPLNRLTDRNMHTIAAQVNKDYLVIN